MTCDHTLKRDRGKQHETTKRVCKVRRRAAVAVFGLVVATQMLSASGFADTPQQRLESGQSSERRAEQLLARMTLDEKIAMLHGDGFVPSAGYAGHIPGNDNLGIPDLFLADGPNGVGNGNTGVTAFPAAINGAATFDTRLMWRYGEAVAAEQAGKGNNVALGPTINILRVPQWGRGFETFSEDPYLTGEIAAAEIEGIQSRGVIATAKHYAGNNQEIDRWHVNVEVSDRALREIYFPGFETAVKEARVGAVMCAYPKVNGTHACENPSLLAGALKRDWGFGGFVMSDWWSIWDTVAAANAGLDMEMPGGDPERFGAALKQAAQSGQVTLARIDDMVRRILTSMFRMGLFDRPASGDRSANVSTPEHQQLAQELSAQGTVLLKNEENVLPLDVERMKSVAVIGDPAADNATITGGGSAAVIPSRVTAPLEGITARAGNNVRVTFAAQIEEAVAAARQSDVAVVFVNNVTSEGMDVPSLALPGDQDRLVEAVAEANPRTVVVLNTATAALMPWLDKVAGVLEVWYPGQQYGDAIASVLFGDVNPSGKLPVTFPADEDQGPAKTPAQYPGDGKTVKYDEGVLVGYRWYDAMGEQPLFPFGHGLSYTTFDYGDLKVSPRHVVDDHGVTVRLWVTNSGSRDGAEVLQLYLGFPPAAGEPPRQLKGLHKVQLEPGQSGVVTSKLDSRALSTWDEGTQRWITHDGSYRIMVGSSSRDIRAAGGFALADRTTRAA